MANAYGTPAQYNEWIAPTDLNLERTVIAVKDSAYKANVVQIESQIEAMGNAPFLRDSDKQMMSDNIRNVTNSINQMSKMQLSRGTAALEASKAIKGAITPYLAEQMSIARGFQEDQKMLEEKRQKNPQLYSDINYTDALEQAGYYQYMSGDTNSMKRLQYVDAYDMGKLDDKVQKWAKNFGKTNSFDSSTQGGITTITKYEQLSESDVQAFIEHSISSDPQLAKQLEINSRQSYKGATDEQFKQEYLNVMKSNVENNDTYIKANRTLLKNYPEGSQERALIQSKIDAYTQRNEEYQKEIDGTIPFNRQSAQFKSYMNGFIGGYIQSYAKTSVVDIDQNTYAFDIQLKKDKFQFELDKYEQEKVAVAEAGTPFERVVELTDKDMSSYAQREASYQTVKQEAFSVLTSDPEFASAKSDKDREEIYKSHLKNIESYDITSGMYDDRTLKILQKAKAEQTALNSYGEKVINYWTPKIDELFNGLGGGIGKDLNVRNLKSTMPITAALLEKGKTDVTKLSKTEKEEVYAEIATNMRDYLAGDDKDILDQLNIVAKGYGGSKKVKGNESRVLDTIGAMGALVGNTFKSAIGSPLVGIFQGSGAERRFRQEIDTEYKNIIKQGDEAYKSTGEAFRNLFKSDTKLSNIQERDINLGNNTQGTEGWFKNVVNTAKSTLNQDLQNVSVGTKVSKGVSFANVDKNEKPYVNAITQLAATKGIKINSTSQYHYHKEGNDYVFTVDADNFSINDKTTGMNKIFQAQSFKIPESQVPDILRNRIGEETPFIEGKTNFRYRAPQDADKRNTYVKNMIIATGVTDNKIIKTIDENTVTFDQIISPYLKDIKTQPQSMKIEAIRNAEFQTKVVKTATGGFKSILEVREVGGTWRGTNIESNVEGKYDPTVFVMHSPALTQMYISSKIKEITGN